MFSLCRRTQSSLIFLLGRSQTHDSARETSSRISCRRTRLTLRADFRVVPFTQIIFQLVNDECSADDGVRAGQRNLHVLDGKLASAGIRDDVTQITSVSGRIRRRTVRHLVRVKVRASGHASVGRVAEFVDVQTVFARRQTGDVADNRRRAGRILLRQSQGARDASGAGENDDRFLLLFLLLNDECFSSSVMFRRRTERKKGNK